jgi:hypothetical protein
VQGSGHPLEEAFIARTGRRVLEVMRVMRQQVRISVFGIAEDIKKYFVLGHNSG